MTEREGTLNYLQENNYSFGYATFWNANVYAGISNGQIEVAGIKNPSTMEPYRWNTLERYFQHDYCKEKTFILLDIDEYSEFKDSKVIQAGEGVYQDDRYIILEYPNSKMIYDLIGE